MLELATDKDVETLAAMRAMEGWYANRRLLQIVKRSSNGRIFVARATERGAEHPTGHVAMGDAVASALAISYGSLGFIGNVLVHPTARQRGLGRSLMEAAIGWLIGSGVGVIDLDATRVGQPLYERLSFEGKTHSWELVAGGETLRRCLEHLNRGPITEAITVDRLKGNDPQELAALDQAAFGGDRLGLLRDMVAAYDAHVYVARDRVNHPTGYAVVRVLDGPVPDVQIGPWIAQSPRVAAHLLDTVLNDEGTVGRRYYANIPGVCAEPVQVLTEWGVPLRRDDLRMRLHVRRERAEPSERAEWVYAMMSTMVG